MPAEIAPRRPAPTLSPSPSPSHKLSPSQRSAAAAAGDFLTNTLGAASCELTPRLIQSPVTNLLSPPSRTHTASHKPQEFQVLWSSRCCCPGWENGFMSFRIFPSCLSDPRLGTEQRAGGCTVQAAEVSLNVIKKYVTVQSAAELHLHHCLPTPANTQTGFHSMPSLPISHQAQAQAGSGPSPAQSGAQLCLKSLNR